MTSLHQISVITICFNNLEDVITTCQSVDRQSQKPFEHLVINGSTTPDIKNHLENNPQPIYRRWINEKDHGISDAFNKGVLNAKGDIVVMLNSGDAFYSKDVISTVTDEFDKDHALQWLHSKYELHRGNLWIIIGK